MQISRRKFIKISSLTSGGLASNLPTWMQFFIDIPATEQNFIPVCGIIPMPDSLEEFGAHLRWTLPPAHGLPELINIYKRTSDPKAPNLLIRPAESDKPHLPSSVGDLRFSGNLTAFRLSTASQFGKAYRTVPNPENHTLKISFDQPVDFCNIQLGKIKKLTARVFFPDSTLSHEVSIEESANYAPLIVHALNNRPFQHVEIPVNFEFLYFIEFNGNTYLCNSKGWKLIDTLHNRKDVEGKMLGKRIAPNTKNYYINSASSGKYSELSKNYTGMMSSFLDPTEKTFQKDPEYNSIADIPGHKLFFKTGDKSVTRLSAWNIFMMGSMDPNIARLLGLYYVDTAIKSEKEIYDYKIEAVYKKKVTTCGVVLKVGGRFSGLPQIEGQLAATQTKSTWWEFDPEYTARHLGKVRLTWKTNELSIESESWKRFVEPVIYGLSINNSPARLISPKAEKNNLVFIDQFVTVNAETKKYRVFGIDLFGQVSNGIVSDIVMKDLDIPAIPTRLNFEQAGNKTHLRFEYGGFQYLADPEVQHLNVYYKHNTIFDHNLKINYHSYTVESRDDTGSNVITLELATPIQNDVPYHTVHFVEDLDGRKLPARERKKFRILSYDNNHLVCVTALNDLPNPSGRVLLEANTRDKDLGWTAIPGARQPFQPPVATRLIGYHHYLQNTSDNTHFSNGLNPTRANSFVANLTHARGIPAGTHRDLFQNNDGSSINGDYTEVYIDRTLNESDIFTGGEMLIGSSRYRILAQRAGYGDAENETLRTKIIIEGYHDFSAGQVMLTPVIQDNPFTHQIGGLMLLLFENNSALINKHTGEFMFRGTKRYVSTKGAAIFHPVEKGEEDHVHVIAKLMSDVRVVGNEAQVLVSIASKVSYLHTSHQASGSNKALYFEPYHAAISNEIAAVSLSPGEAFKNVFFTANAVDVNNHQSELSVIAQFIKTRNKNDKPVAPPAPFPCGDRPATEAFLKLPNSAGKSYFLLCWDGSNDYRYEVGRAMDKTVLITHKSLWLNGQVADPSGFSAASIAGSGLTIQSVGSPSIVRVPRSNFINLPETYKYGRMSFGSGSVIQHFEIVKLEEDGSSVLISLRTLLSGQQPGNNSWVISPSPDYQTIGADVLRVRDLADECPSAFSIVTGQALRNTTEFLDEVPGVGGGYFFYKVRSVDAGEIRSDWSLASVPVWQVDTRVPDAKDFFKIVAGNKSARICIRATDILANEFLHVYRSTNIDSLPSQALIVKLAGTDITGYQLWRNMPVVYEKGLVDLSFLKKAFPSLTISTGQGGILKVFLYDESTNTVDTSKDLLVRTSTMVIAQSIQNLESSIAEEEKVVVAYLNREGEIKYIFHTHLNGRDIKVENRNILFYPGYTINLILGIYDASLIRRTGNSIALIDPEFNLWTIQSSFDVTTGRIVNLRSISENIKLAVVARVTREDGQIIDPFIIETVIGVPDQLFMLPDRSVNLFNLPKDIKGIYKLSDYDKREKKVSVTAKNYFIKAVSEFDTTNYSLKNLSDEVPNGATIAIEIRNTDNLTLMIKDNDQLKSYLDSPLQVGFEYYYTGIIERKIKSQDKAFDIFSKASKAVRVIPFDLNIPLIPEVQLMWWDKDRSAPANPSTAIPVALLRWESHEQNVTYKVFKWADNSNSWVFLGYVSDGVFNLQGNLQSFVYEDSAVDSLNSYRYKLSVVNASGVENADGAVNILSQLR
jgi:hypothetical protein